MKGSITNHFLRNSLGKLIVNIGQAHALNCGIL